MAQFKTLQFPNTARGQADKIRALERETSLGWRVVSETIVPGKFRGGQACCFFMIFAPCAFLAGHSDDIITVTLERDSDSSGEPSVGAMTRPKFDRQKWNALLMYDKDIASAAEQVRPFGPKWMDEFAAGYMALNEAKYIPEIVQSVIKRARDEQLETEARLAREEERRRTIAQELEDSALKRKERYAYWYNMAWGTNQRRIWTVILCGAIAIGIIAILSSFGGPSNGESPVGGGADTSDATQAGSSAPQPPETSPKVEAPATQPSITQSESSSDAPPVQDPAIPPAADSAPVDTPAVPPNDAPAGPLPDGIMGPRFGNTEIMSSSAAEWHLYFKADGTFAGKEVRSSFTIAGTWVLDGANLCLTFEPALNGTPNPDCKPVSAHQVGDTWNSNGNAAALVSGIQ